jgi:LysM repeat protein
MADSSPARIAAPLALVAAVVSIVVVIAASQTGGDSATVRAGRPAVHRTVHHKPRPRTVVVRAGDTLSAISTRTGVAIETLQALNPNVDPQALQTGERLKLR